MCVCVRLPLYTYVYVCMLYICIHKYIHTYIYIYVGVSADTRKYYTPSIGMIVGHLSVHPFDIKIYSIYIYNGGLSMIKLLEGGQLGLLEVRISEGYEMLPGTMGSILPGRQC